MSIPRNLLDIPPFQFQSLIPGIVTDNGAGPRNKPRITCAQALGLYGFKSRFSPTNVNTGYHDTASEIYVGCSNGELVRFALQASDPNLLESYTILSRYIIPKGKPVDNVVILPSLSRLLVQSDRQIHFFVLPSLDPVTNIKPIRNVLTFAVDHRHLQRPPIIINESVEFSVIKRSGIAMFSLRNDKLFYQKEIPLPSDSPPALACKRVGHVLCYADNDFYSMVDLDQASLFQLLPLRQSVEDTPFEIKPIIQIIGENELLILSWTGASALGVFITGDGDPVRGTLEWTGYPKAVCLDYPYITSLLPDETTEVHSIETQSIMQVIKAPTQSDAALLSLTTSLHGYLVPSTEKSRKMEKVKIGLFRGSMKT